VGIDTGDTIEITSGVTINDKVVTKGQTYLADGDALNIVSDNGNAVETATEATTAPAEGEEAKK
ncbi:MAG: efflux transporter periplasmic adaptor subunit, partial [Clostridia bacterium]|nr:efflux transporter periplasmic adaptor subunit [Clostridia bacterium]